jgi:hypothetical protein
MDMDRLDSEGTLFTGALRVQRSDRIIRMLNVVNDSLVVDGGYHSVENFYRPQVDDWSICTRLSHFRKLACKCAETYKELQAELSFSQPCSQVFSL